MASELLPHTPDLAPTADRRLDVADRLPHAIQRVALGQYERMRANLVPGLDDPDAGVHTARKAMKRQRALLRLVRDEVGNRAYRNENVVLRDVARILAPVRDGYVLVETLDRLRDEYAGVLAADAFAITREYLVAAHGAARRAVLDDAPLMTHVRVTLSTAAARMARWDSADLSPRPSRLAAVGLRDEFAAIAPGLARVYRRGRRGMQHAYREGTTAAFHEWRKRVKYLRYQLESLEPIWPELLGAHSARLDQLGELLGDDHDLAVLDEIVRDHDEASGDQRERTLLLALIHRTRLELQWQARPLGAALYAETPNQFVTRIGAYFDAARG